MRGTMDLMSASAKVGSGFAVTRTVPMPLRSATPRMPLRSTMPPRMTDNSTVLPEPRGPLMSMQ